MYTSNHLTQSPEGHFTLRVEDRPFKILQLTDLHLGFGWLSKRKDALALDAIKTLIERSGPDFIAITGDAIFPYIPKTGTRNNRVQAKGLCDFLDGFKIPYGFVFGNHDVEMGSKGSKADIAKIISDAKYSIFTQGPESLTGMGNYMIKLKNPDGSLRQVLAFLDSNMYRDGWFYSGFDCIREDQTKWFKETLSAIHSEEGPFKAMAFFHMPLPEFKQAYERLKLGESDVSYHFGSIGEADDYLGISKYPCDFFQACVTLGNVQALFCGHDHLNTLSMTYKGIRMTYGMSIDFTGYKKIDQKYTQRGGTLITLSSDGAYKAAPLPLTTVVSKFVRGVKKPLD